jgi:hypothetical protein
MRYWLGRPGLHAGAFLAAALACGGAMADLSSQSFRQWNAVCFSEAGCEATTADREPIPPGDNLRLVVERTGAEAPGWFVALEFLGGPPDPKRVLTFRFDDGTAVTLTPPSDLEPYRSPERFYVTDPGALSEILPAMLRGEDRRSGYVDITKLGGARLRVEYVDVAAEPRSYALSLEGLTAAMLWIEEELGIVGEPRRAVPPQGLPRTEPLPASEAASRAGIPPPVIATHLAQSGCEAPDTELMRQFEPIIETLSDTAILYAIPCTAGAYNVAFRLYVRETGEIGGVRTLYFATYSDTHHWSGTDLLYNIVVDGPTLTAVFKGRGPGDCGTQGEWTWVDYGYRLDRFVAQEECRGVPPERWPVVFPPR